MYVKLRFWISNVVCCGLIVFSDFNVRGDCLFCSYCLTWRPSLTTISLYCSFMFRWSEVIVCFVDIVRLVDHHWQPSACIALFMFRWSEVIVHFIDIGGIVDHHCLNILCFVDICRIFDHHCLNFLFIIQHYHTIFVFLYWLTTICFITSWYRLPFFQNTHSLIVFSAQGA